MMIRQFLLFAALASVFTQQAMASSDLVILPPNDDFKTTCKPTLPLDHGLDAENLRKKELSNLTPSQLSGLLNLYSRGYGNTAPDYDYTRRIIEYVSALPTTSQYQDVRHDALFTKYRMLYRGNGYPRDLNAAQAVLDELLQDPTSNRGKVYNRYGDLFFHQKNYNKAAEFHKNAIIEGEVSSYSRLAEIYYRKHVPATEEQINTAIRNAQNTALQRIAIGDCAALSWMGLMYDYMEGLPNSERYAMAWHEKAAMTDDPRAKLRYAAMLQRSGNNFSKHQIIRLWYDAAKLGNARAMFLLGEHYLLNEENKQDKAIEWLEVAAKYRNLKAAELLARIYKGHYGVQADPTKRRVWLEIAAQHEHVKSNILDTLAAIYETDDTVPPAKLLALYEKSAQLGSDHAYIKLGDSYRYGIGRPAEPTRALRYYRLAASNGKSRAMDKLADAYICEIGKPKDEQKADFWMQQRDYYSMEAALAPFYATLEQRKALSAKQVEDLRFIMVTRKNPHAMLALGVHYSLAGESSLAQEWIDKALAADERKDTQYKVHYQLGKFYHDGLMLEDNKAKGLELIERSAQAGNNSAYNTLGHIYREQGQADKAVHNYHEAAKRGKSSSYGKMFEIYKEQNKLDAAKAIMVKAAKMGNVDAMLTLAKGYDKDGWMQTPDAAKARSWFKEAIAHFPCDEDDIETIAKSYKKGKNGAPKDVATAKLWAERIDLSDDAIAETNSLDALISAALTFKDNKATEQSNAAFNQLRTLAESGDTQALFALANISLTRLTAGIDNTPDIAIYWLEQSANKGDTAAMAHLGNLYLSGSYVETSRENAIIWLEKAAASGDMGAAKKLQILGKN